MATTTEKLRTFKWKGINKKGTSVNGEIMGNSIALVKLELRRQGIQPTHVVKQSMTLFGSGMKKIESQDIGIFIRQLATMLGAGIPLVQAIDIVSKGQTNQSMQKLLTTVRTDLEAGNSLAETLKKHPKHFDGLFCNLAQAGEQSGTLEPMLQRIASYRERSESLKGKIKKALFYPAAVVSVAIIVSVALLIFVVPQFESVFKNAGTELPALTRHVISVSRWMQNYWYLFFGILGAAGFAIVQSFRTSEAFAFAVDKYLLKFPVIGDILTKAIIARFTRTLATTFAAGMPLVDSLNAVSGAAGNRVFAKATIKIRDEVSTGQTLQSAMLTTNLFPSIVVQMVAIGEESGSLEQMLNKVADFYEEQVNNAVDALTSLLEPLIMVVLGVIVGTLIVAMYLPIFKLGNAL